MADFKVALPKILRHEGVTLDDSGIPVAGKTGWVNHVDDPGGETNYGITRGVATANGYTGPMRDISFETVMNIYKRRYWDQARLDECPDQDVATEIFDTAVNAGVGRAVTFLQRALNATNDKGKRWADVAATGEMSQATVDALRTALASDTRHGLMIRRALDCLQGSHYIGLADRDTKYESFMRGWLLNRIGD